MDVINLIENKAKNLFYNEFTSLSMKEKYNVVAAIVNDISYERVHKTNKYLRETKQRQVYYFSMEFLMGRLLTSNLMNIGLYNVFKIALENYNIDINDIENQESDAGLGNGGLGRLAACFVDSLASNSYPGMGITLRYRGGFFKQAFEDNNQVEYPDLWLQEGNMWEQRIFSDSCEVSFYGSVIAEERSGRIYYNTINDVKVKAMPYDMPIIGANNETCNVLRMYDILPVEQKISDGYIKYEKELMDITSCLYPDDSTVKGVELRIKQQYFFVSAGLSNIIKRHLELHGSLDNFHEHNVIQINDTHPALLIPELMRTLIDIHNYDWDRAWYITTQTIAYTNHTILSEALEKWDQLMIQNLLPRCFMIIEEINRQFVNSLRSLNYDNQKIYKLSIIQEGKVHMAHLSIVGSFSVNGVAALHTQIIKEKLMYDWNILYPTKFNNKTNGITQRRWLENCNRELCQLLEDNIGMDFKVNPVNGFNKLIHYYNDTEMIKKLSEVKSIKKLQLKKYIFDTEGIEINENSIFDIQIKRLHAYKRQLLNVLHIIYLYQQIKHDTIFKDNFYPQTFFFGAKAAPGYYFAKNVIKLINTLSSIINNDNDVNSHIKVVMVENYNVSYAEKLIPAANISEQISTAGYEASGTGNMKFMMNGALTIGTLDGANVEIHELVGDDNIQIFGLEKNEVFDLQKSGSYNAYKEVEQNVNLQNIFKFINDIHLYDNNVTFNDFKHIFVDIFDNNDYYLILKDFDSYLEAQASLNNLYKNQAEWNKKCLVNIAKSGYFSSDRTIEDYVKEIWKLRKIEM